MNELRGNLRAEFQDKDYRHAYADESLNTYIATQIKVLREQRTLTQKQLAELTGMAQPRIAVLEDVNYSSWSINTLRRIAEAFDLRLSVKFETFSSLLPEIENLNRESLERASFDDDSWFHKKDVQPEASPILETAYAVGQKAFDAFGLRRKGAEVIPFPSQGGRGLGAGASSAAASAR